jgi:hypothetical protein
MKRATLVRIAGMFVVSALIDPGAALAQTAPTPHSMKTIGTPSGTTKPEIVPSLFVLNSGGATLQGGPILRSRWLSAL